MDIIIFSPSLPYPLLASRDELPPGRSCPETGTGASDNENVKLLPCLALPLIQVSSAHSQRYPGWAVGASCHSGCSVEQPQTSGLYRLPLSRAGLGGFSWNPELRS